MVHPQSTRFAALGCSRSLQRRKSSGRQRPQWARSGRSLPCAQTSARRDEPDLGRLHDDWPKRCRSDLCAPRDETRLTGQIVRPWLAGPVQSRDPVANPSSCYSVRRTFFPSL